MFRGDLESESAPEDALLTFSDAHIIVMRRLWCTTGDTTMAIVVRSMNTIIGVVETKRE